MKIAESYCDSQDKISFEEIGKYEITFKNDKDYAAIYS